MTTPPSQYTGSMTFYRDPSTPDQLANFVALFGPPVPASLRVTLQDGREFAGTVTSVTEDGRISADGHFADACTELSCPHHGELHGRCLSVSPDQQHHRCQRPTHPVGIYDMHRYDADHTWMP